MLNPDSMPVAEVMTRAIHAVREDTALAEAAELLLSKEVTGVPVVGPEGKPVGVLSLRDILQAVRPGQPAHAADAPTLFYGALDLGELRELLPRHRHDLEGKVADFMSKRVISCRSDESLRAVAQAMVGRSIHRLLVVDADGKLVGLVSSLDLAALLAR